MTARTKMLLLAVFVPPIAVGLLKGAGTEFFTCVILTLCFFVPGVVYAVLCVRAA